jgi:hypothetical protein
MLVFVVPARPLVGRHRNQVNARGTKRAQILDHAA